MPMVLALTGRCEAAKPASDGDSRLAYTTNASTRCSIGVSMGKVSRGPGRQLICKPSCLARCSHARSRCASTTLQPVGPYPSIPQNSLLFQFLTVAQWRRRRASNYSRILLVTLLFSVPCSINPCSNPCHEESRAFGPASDAASRP